MITLKNLKVEFMRRPLGLDAENPRFSWEAESDEYNVKQVGYRLVCAADADFSCVLYDSGPVCSSAQNNIEYAGDALPPFTRIHWKVVAAYETAEAESTNFFETGFMGSPWDAQWIRAEASEDGTRPCMIYQAAFDCPPDIKQARLYCTALGLYNAFINGSKTGDDELTPGWTSYKHWIRYQTYDITSDIRQGNNRISILLGNGWYCGRMMDWTPTVKYGNEPALLAQIRLEKSGGEIITVSTDTSWKCCESQVLFSDIYDGEIIDMTKANALTQQDVVSVNGLDGIKITGQTSPPIKRIGSIHPVDIITTPKGETVVDFGQNFSGWVKVSLTAKKGDRVKLLFGEMLENGNFYNANMRTAKAEALFILDAGEQVAEPHFTYYGFRYVKLAEYPCEPELSHFEGIVLSSGIDYESHFECSDPKLNRLFLNAHWGQKSNFLDIPSDCPQRDERLGWTGDIQVFAATAAYHAQAAGFFEKWLTDLAYDQLDNGAVPSIIPNIFKESFYSAGWGDACVIVPYITYRFFNDRRVIENQYESMKKWIEYIRHFGSIETLWEGGEHYGDWLALDGYGVTQIRGATNADLIASAMYYHSTTLFAEMAAVIGRDADAQAYQALAESIKQAFRREFITATGRVASETQTAYALALMFGLVAGEEAHAAECLVRLVRKQKHRITTGFIGTPYILHVLAKHHYLADAYQMLLNEECPGWLYQVNHGATTIWERWNGIMPNGELFDPEMNSFNHYAYGAVAQWMYEYILGIQATECGFSAFRVAPKLSRHLTYAGGAVQTICGKIETKWSITNERFTIEITIPANTTAELYLPYTDMADLAIKHAKPSPDGLRLQLGSGRHEFSYPVEAQS